MASKKEEKAPYGSTYVPQGEKKYQIIRWGWNGLNEKDDIDTGQLTAMSGMVCDPPYMEPQKKPKLWLDFTNGIPHGANTVSGAGRRNGIPIGIYGMDQQLILLWEDHTENLGPYEYATSFKQTQNDISLASRSLNQYNPLYSEVGKPHSVVQFNAVDTSSGNIAAYTYDKKILIYPNCYSIPYYFTWGGAASDFNPNDDIPVSSLASVYGSRVFGSNDNAVFASDYNSYAAYNLDTADDVSSAHAWWSMTQSNTDADGAFTAVCTFDNHVVLFKKDFMQLVYNNKNPFRIVDVGKFGCDNEKAWTIMDGVLYFASQDKVYAFTGGTPKEISTKLDVDSFHGAVMGSYNGTLWLAVDPNKKSLSPNPHAVYTYSKGVWSFAFDTMFIGGEYDHGWVVQFATLDYGVAALLKYPAVPSQSLPERYRLYFFDWDIDKMDEIPIPVTAWDPEYFSNWYFETDLMALGKLDIRRVKKVSMMCKGDKDSEVKVYLLKDGEDRFDTGPANKVGEMKLDSDGLHILRVLTRQFSGTMHRLVFIGKGYMKIYAAELKISWGGDIYVED